MAPAAGAADYQKSFDAEDESDLKPQIEMNAYSLDCFEKLAEVEAAASSGPALKHWSCWGSSVAAETEAWMLHAVWKDLWSLYPEAQRRPLLDIHRVAYLERMDRTLVASKE